MFLRTERIAPKKMIGFSTMTTLANDQTFSIWQQLMPRLKEIKNAVSADLFSLQIYDSESLQTFTPTTAFKKYALVEVKNYDEVPLNFEKLDLPSGNYAVFLHKGVASEFHKTSQYIFGEWLPNSEFELDDRPHFALMGDNYHGHENPTSEEEVWIPIKEKK